jgi:hypothetical protein
MTLSLRGCSMRWRILMMAVLGFGYF